MTRKLRALTIVVMAAFAATAVVASDASAVDLFTSTSTNAKTIVTGEQVGKHKIVIIGQPLECSIVHFEATQSGNSSEDLSFTPKYEGHCTYNGQTASVTANSCKFTVKSQTNEGGHNVVQIVNCPTGAPLILHIIVGGLPCTLTIIEQTVSEGVKFTNETTGIKKAETMHSTTKIKIHAASATPLACKAMAGTSPPYSGLTTLIGKEDTPGGAQVDITVDEAPDAT